MEGGGGGERESSGRSGGSLSESSLESGRAGTRKAQSGYDTYSDYPPLELTHRRRAAASAFPLLFGSPSGSALGVARSEAWQRRSFAGFPMGPAPGCRLSKEPRGPEGVAPRPRPPLALLSPSARPPLGRLRYAPAGRSDLVSGLTRVFSNLQPFSSSR
ncbi:hypothetical protein KM043_003120 [Ampulex compressa]|nr:hypothetical protein KM043_003120 [Ampulex compressa]